jgi:type II secretory pathway component PulJ
MRPAYTLLEVLLAMVIGILLMAALYAAVDAQLTNSRAGREIIEASNLARSVLDRVAADIGPSLAPISPSRLKSSSQAASASQTQLGAAGSAPATTGAASTTGATSSGTTTDTSSSATSPSSASGTTGSGVTFNQGVQGDATHLTLYTSRWPRELRTPADDANAPVLSDLRRVTWWLAGGGLSRQEIKQATSDDALNAPDLSDNPALVIASQVTNLTFQYLDGSSGQWQDTWDGTIAGPDGSTPIGPPAAIAVTIEITLPGGGPNARKSYRHVVALPTANGTTSSTSNSATNTQGGTTP